LKGYFRTNKILENIYKMQVYQKKVSPKELEILKITSDSEISPRLISWKNILGSNSNYIIAEIELYPLTLDDIPINKRKFYVNAIKNKLMELYNLNIFHGDIHEENIVINPETEQVRLIDFGRSKFFNEITPNFLLRYDMYFDVVDNIQDLLAIELREVDIISGIN